MKTIERIGWIWLAAIIAMSTFPVSAAAKTPYEGYTYDQEFNVVSSLNGYVYVDSIDGHGSGLGPFSNIEDVYVAEDDTIYIVDSGNNRVVHTDRNQTLLGIYGGADGPVQLNGPKGVYAAPNGDVYVADTRNNRVLVFAKDGQLIREFNELGDTRMIGQDFTFLPAKIVADRRGYMFLTSDGVSQGLLQLDPNGKFAGFFGANHVPFDWMRLLTNLVATEEQKAQLAAKKPPEFSNVFMDTEGYMYTTTLGMREKQIKRLSAVGVDTLNAQATASGRYGDYQMRLFMNERVFEAFVDVTVDAQGFITGLDLVTGRAFQYDSMGNLLFIFGGIGPQNGLFVTPSSIAQTSDGTIYIADKTRNRIDRFQATPFGELVRKASILYTEGRYQESEEPWREVLRRNSNYDLAYLAIGKSLYKQERLEEAMHYFRIARAREPFSEAFTDYRRWFMRENFGTFLAGIALLYVLAKSWKVWRRRRNRKSKSLYAKGVGIDVDL